MFGSLPKVSEGYCNPFTPSAPLANSVDPDQSLQNAASDLGLRCLHQKQEFIDKVRWPENLTLPRNKRADTAKEDHSE